MVKSGDSIKEKKKFSAREREDILIENFVGLQKAMTHLSIKFEVLSDNISKLLTIFELSAKDYLINKGRINPDADRDVLNKINSLLEQNKTIAKGLVVLEEKVKGKPPEQQMQPQQNFGPQNQFKPKPLQGI